MSRGTHCANPSAAITKHCVCGSERFVPLPATCQRHLLNGIAIPCRCYHCVLRRDWKKECSPKSSLENCVYQKIKNRTCKRLTIYVSTNISLGYKYLLNSQFLILIRSVRVACTFSTQQRLFSSLYLNIDACKK